MEGKLPILIGIVIVCFLGHCNPATECVTNGQCHYLLLHDSLWEQKIGGTYVSIKENEKLILVERYAEFRTKNYINIQQRSLNMMLNEKIGEIIFVGEYHLYKLKAHTPNNTIKKKYMHIKDIHQIH